MNSAPLTRACVRHTSVCSIVFRRAVTAAVVFVVLGASAFAQSASVGSIQGRVQNATNGLYLKNARITVEGTAQEALTNEFGEYVLSEVPAGAVTLKVFYTGLEQESLNVNLQAGQTFEQDFRLSSVRFAQEVKDNVIQLDQFVVATARETNANAIAVSEQRFAPNVKVVVAADAFGDVTEGNVGEFVKYLPGVTVDYNAADVRWISIRGFSSSFTTIYVDGARVASAASGSSNRFVELEQLSINNAGRVEVIKVPTPDVSADVLGGAINLVSRSAFEQDKPVFKWKASLSVSNEDLQFWRKTPGPSNQSSYKALPGVEFNYIAPLSKNLGIAVSFISSNQFNEQHRSQPTWNFTQAGATAVNPYLNTYATQDGPKVTYRDSLSFKVDWKPRPGHVLAATYQFNYYKNFFGNRNLNFNTGTTSVPTPTTGTAMTYGPTFTYGATGRGTVTQGSSFRDKLGAANVVVLTYNYKGKAWELAGGVNWSQSKSYYRDLEKGHWNAVTTSMQGVSRVLYDGIDNPRPATFSVLNTANAALDYTRLANYRITTLRSSPLDATDIVSGYNASAKRHLGTSFPSSIKVGGEIREMYRDIRRYQGDTTFVGPDRLGNTADDAAWSYQDMVYDGVDPYWGFTPIQWADPFRLGMLYRDNPAYFAQTLTQQVNALRFKIANSQKLTETISAAYLRYEARFLGNRLGIVTGVRFEQTAEKGTGSLINPRLAFDASGTRIATAGSVLETQLTRLERGFTIKKTYDGYYPSFHATYNITDNLIARFAYAKTLGRPDLGNLLPSVRVNDTASADNTDGLGTVPANTVIATNPALKPWEADNYDLSFEYYFPDGGVVSLGGFAKNLKNFFGQDTHTLTAAEADEYDIPSSYVGVLSFQQPINTGTSKVSGAEFNFMHPLNFLPWWGKYINFSANGTILHLQGDSSSQFTNFIPKSGNIGFTFSKKPVVLMVKWNYRGQQRQGTNTATPNAFDWYASRTYVDLNAEYQLSKRFAVFANARNITNKPQTWLRYSTATPLYAQLQRVEEFGIQWAIGVKGTF
jgi:iron complex outermembrane receptor protein